MKKVIFDRHATSVCPSTRLRKNHILIDSNGETVGILSDKLSVDEALGHVAWLKDVYERGVEYGKWKAQQDMRQCLGIEDE